MCCLFLCNLTSQSIETYGKINLAGMCSHPTNANRLRCQTKKRADMGTFNTEWIVTINLKKNERKTEKQKNRKTADLLEKFVKGVGKNVEC